MVTDTLCPQSRSDKENVTQIEASVTPEGNDWPPIDFNISNDTGEEKYQVAPVC